MTERVTEPYTLELAEEHIGNLNGNVDRIGEALTQDDTDLIPNTPAAGNIQYSVSGHSKYVSSDGQDYNTGRNTNPSTGTLSFTTSFQTVPGLTVSLGVGTYRIHSQILVNNPGTAGQGAISIQLTAQSGLTASSGRYTATEIVENSQSLWVNWNTLGGSLTSLNSPGANTFARLWTVDGLFVISVAGTLALQMKQAATAASNTLQSGTYLESMPVT